MTVSFKDQITLTEACSISPTVNSRPRPPRSIMISSLVMQSVSSALACPNYDIGHLQRHMMLIPSEPMISLRRKLRTNTSKFLLGANELTSTQNS